MTQTRHIKVIIVSLKMPRNEKKKKTLKTYFKKVYSQVKLNSLFFINEELLRIQSMQMYLTNKTK